MKKFEINPRVQIQNNKIKIPSQSKFKREGYPHLTWREEITASSL